MLHQATLAQLVEQRTENPRVRSSILRGGTTFPPEAFPVMCDNFS